MNEAGVDQSSSLSGMGTDCPDVQAIARLIGHRSLRAIYVRGLLVGLVVPANLAVGTRCRHFTTVWLET